MSKKTATAETIEDQPVETIAEPTSPPEPTLEHNAFNAMTIDAKVQHLQKRCDWLTSKLAEVAK